MRVRIVTFPETRVASILHVGAPDIEHITVRKLVAWKRENRLLDPVRHRSYGLHYTDPSIVEPEDYRVEFCLSIDRNIDENAYGIAQKIVPRMKCAYARDIGSRLNNKSAAYLYGKWLPASGEALCGYPIIFYYVNVGPNVTDEEAVTDVYMPLQ